MTESNAKTDHSTVIGIALCGIPVGTFSSYTLFTTAHGAGVPAFLAWVLPVATDLSAIVATRVWLSARYPASIRRYAATIAIIAMALSFVGASLHYAVETSPWWLRMAVGGLPSLSLAALVHLGALIVAYRADKPPRGRSGKGATAPRVDAAPEPRLRVRPDRKSAPNVSAPEARAVAPTVAPDASGALAPNVTEEGEQAAPAAAEVPAPRAETVRPESTNVVALNEGRATRERMLAYLDDHPEATGAELDRAFKTKNYGARVRRAWQAQQAEREKVSGE